LHSHKDHQVLFVGGPNTRKTNPRWRTAAILKNCKIVMSQPRFEQFRQNLARRCSSTLLSVPNVKNLKFPKSKMAAAAILQIENRPYLRNVLPDLREIWYGDAYLMKLSFYALFLNFWTATLDTGYLIRHFSISHSAAYWGICCLFVFLRGKFCPTDPQRLISLSIKLSWPVPAEITNRDCLQGSHIPTERHQPPFTHTDVASKFCMPVTFK